MALKKIPTDNAAAAATAPRVDRARHFSARGAVSLFSRAREKKKALATEGAKRREERKVNGRGRRV